MRKLKCDIVNVGKRRDGGTRFWCLRHKADATAKYGRQDKQCRYAHILPPSPDQILKLNIRDFEGGVALWGAVAPIYDTTTLELERGVHVHARHRNKGKKFIDSTYRVVSLDGCANDLFSLPMQISELDAIYYMVSNVLGFSTKYIECTYCKYPHLDKDWFSVHPHQRHLCAGCGKKFGDNERAIGNPLANVQLAIAGKTYRPRAAPKSIDIVQASFADGIQIWGSNPSIVWTAGRGEEEGIHIHAIGKNGIDDTFSRVSIDGITLDARMVRTHMAQTALPHIAGRVISLNCSKCNEPHFDTGEFSFTPHEVHACLMCKTEFRSPGRTRKTICNPLIDIFRRLADRAPRPPRKHDLGLLPESI